MAKLTMNQIAGLALNAGWSANEAAIATAIAMAESGGQTDVLGDTGITTSKWGASVGLWQIRSLKADRNTGRTRDAVVNLNPVVNAQHAFEISNGGSNWTPWSVYSSGKYRAHLLAAKAAVSKPDYSIGPTGATGKGSAGSAQKGTGGLDMSALDAITNPQNWFRIGQFVLGLVLLVIGLFKLTGAGAAIANAGVAVGKAVVLKKVGV